MKCPSSLTKLLVVMLMATLTQIVQAAAITPDGRQELVALYIVMFGRAPTTVQLAQMVVARENGQTLAQVATNLSAETDFTLVASKDADSFATYLTDNLLSSDVPAEDRAISMNWVVTQVQGTKSKAQVIAEAVQTIRATTASDYLSSKAALSASVSAALVLIDNPTPSATLAATNSGFAEKKNAATSALNDLIEIAEDLKIEEEDNSAFYKQVLNQSGGTDKPSVTLAKLQALKNELASATTVAAVNAIQEKMKLLQAAMSPWVNFAGTNLGSGSKNLTDQGLQTIRAMNAQVTSILTGSGSVGGGGGSCRSVYNTTTHSFQTVC